MRQRQTNNAPQREPARRPDGTCAACVGGWLCEYHRETTARAERNRMAAVVAAAGFIVRHRAAMARFESGN